MPYVSSGVESSSVEMIDSLILRSINCITMEFRVFFFFFRLLNSNYIMVVIAISREHTDPIHIAS